MEVTYTWSVAVELLLVASTRSSAFPAEYSASWMDTVSAATKVGVPVFVGEGMAVGVRVAEGPGTVGGRVEVGVKDGPMAVGVRVEVGSGAASRLISMERAADQAPITCPAVRARTRHQKRRSLVKVCVVWVWVSPVCAANSGLVNELESSNWIS